MSCLSSNSSFRCWSCTGEIFPDTPTGGLENFTSPDFHEHAFAAEVFISKGDDGNFTKAKFHLKRLLMFKDAKETDPLDYFIILCNFFDTTLEDALTNDDVFFRICKDFFERSFLHK